MKSGRAPTGDWKNSSHWTMPQASGKLLVLIGCPDTNEGSVTSRMARNGVIALQTGAEQLLELQFDGGHRATTLDFQAGLALLLRV